MSSFIRGLPGIQKVITFRPAFCATIDWRSSKVRKHGDGDRTFPRLRRKARGHRLRLQFSKCGWFQKTRCGNLFALLCRVVANMLSHDDTYLPAALAGRRYDHDRAT